MDVTLNGCGGRVSRKGRDVVPAVPKQTAKGRRVEQARRDVVLWAHRYTAGAVVLSAGLNAWASVQDSGASNVVLIMAAAVVGGVVPVGVWVLSKLAGHLVRAGWRRMAGAAGGVGVFLLALSLWHCSAAIAGLTGAAWLLALLLAVGIDCGLVVSELAAVLVREDG
jgi:hypothetical protein